MRLCKGRYPNSVKEACVDFHTCWMHECSPTQCGSVRSLSPALRNYGSLQDCLYHRPTIHRAQVPQYRPSSQVQLPLLLVTLIMEPCWSQTFPMAGLRILHNMQLAWTLLCSVTEHVLVCFILWGSIEGTHEAGALLSALCQQAILHDTSCAGLLIGVGSMLLCLKGRSVCIILNRFWRWHWGHYSFFG